MTVKAVLWDLGNVLLDWDPAYLYRDHFDDAAELQHFLSEVCNMTWHTEHDRGVPMAKNRIALIEQYPHYEAQIRLWESGLPKMVSGTIAGTPEAMDALAERGVPQYALTNMPIEWLDYVLTYAPMRHMRDIVVSSQEGVVKPDPKIYAVTQDRLPHAASEILFFDDRMTNVDAARAHGFKAEQYTGADALHAALIAHGLLETPPAPAG